MRNILGLPAALLLLYTCSASSAENATIPYATVFNLVTTTSLQTRVLTTSLPVEPVKFYIRSKNPEVKPADIQVYIESTSGRIDIPLGADGTFALPISRALIEENPPIHANQPKGSMVLEGTITAHPIDAKWSRPLSVTNNTTQYRDLFRVEALAQDIEQQVKTAGSFPSVTLTPEGSIFELTPNETNNATLVIHARQGDIDVPLHSGRFTVQFDKTLYEENPDVTFSRDGKWRMRKQTTQDAEPAGGAYVAPAAGAPSAHP